MINRTLIRLKVVQLVYAYYLDEGKTTINAEKELQKSLEKAYTLYLMSLQLIIAITGYARKRIEEKAEINKAAHISEAANMKFVDNRFVKTLASNKMLQENIEAEKLSWADEIPYLRSIYEKIISSDFYKEYMQKGTTSYEEDRELWRTLYKRIISKDEELDEVLEEKSLYWNDDRVIVDTFVFKTIKRMTEEGGSDQPLEPDYKDDEDREYAMILFKQTIKNGDEYRELIARTLRNWEFDRLAYMDIVIMQTAIAEFKNFPNIPLSVTINEYVEIAKWYSTPNSGSYVNGVLDAIAKRLDDRMKLK